ncbi:hypothetical protein N855_gp39 [Mycobacterium phage Muddy]|uniref:Uncharacterized protein n=2 Tax=Mycobacterium phage Muddy TaxID=1340829 RepID=A0ACD4QAC8_9CAUD|nr:hypothetical protein N855_gp39 [Mycobacterium phage Muddy]WEV84083.1 hypothetical protein PBI_MUDDY_39 [Mycobacterium phage Muddy]
MGKKQVSKKEAKILELKAQKAHLQAANYHLQGQLEQVDELLRKAEFTGTSERAWLQSFQALVLHLARIRGIGPTPFLDFSPQSVPMSTHDPRTGQPLVNVPEQALIDRLVAEDSAAGTHTLMSTDEVSDAT